MSLFSKPLNEKPGNGKASPSAKNPVSLRQPLPSDIKQLVELERICYRPLVKDANGKFCQPMKIEKRLDEEFEVELLPRFLLGEEGFTEIQNQLGREIRMNVLVGGDHVIGCAMYGVDRATNIISIGTVLIHPQAPIAGAKKLFDWFEGVAEHSMNEFNCIYDMPDALDTPMLRVFKYLSENQWSWVHKRDVYPGNVDAWQFKKVFGSTKYKKGDRKTQKSE